MSQPLWRPSPQRIASANLTAFSHLAEKTTGRAFPNYDSLHAWSVERPEDFWSLLWDCAQVIGEKGARVLVNGGKMPGAKWFPDARLNYAENLLRRRDETDALVFWGEDKARRRMSRATLYDQVARAAQVFAALGVAPGDRVAGYMPNMPEALIAMLAAASLGAVWSSASPDFGVQGVLDRFGQIAPKILVACDGYHYNGKSHDVLEKLKAITAQLPTVEQTLVVPYVAERPNLDGLPKTQLWTDALSQQKGGEIIFRRLPFDHPLFIMYSSGTTGAPKCIVHCAGGALLQHLKEHRLHCDILPNDRVLYFTTCGWMMWNWLMSALASEATLLLYDGAPTYPRADILFDYADAEGMTLFGTSAKFLDAIAKANLAPIKTHKLTNLRAITSTGSPLVAEGFEYVYRAIKNDVHLASISGGTDLLGCFVLGNPAAPVWAGEIQAKGLGMKVEVFDETGHSQTEGKGELVCTTPFPSMPVGFWNDPDGAKYHNAYFARFPGIWCHGDWMEFTPNGGAIIYGRSDATLNPGGVRIGTAEIYRQVERLPEILESLVIGQDWDNDVRVVLFVRLADHAHLTPELEQQIRTRIRSECTPRHVPAKIVAVTDIPRTKSGKIVELAVRDVVHGRTVKNREALANPEALDLFKDLAALKT